MNFKLFWLSVVPFSFFFLSCSPLKSSPKEEKVQMELTLHDLQTNGEDCRHDLNCLQADFQLLEGKIKILEELSSSFKQEFVEKFQGKLDVLTKQYKEIESQNTLQSKEKDSVTKDLVQLSSHASDTSSALSQFKERLSELEKMVLSQNRKIEEISQLKTTLDHIAKSLGPVSISSLSKEKNLYRVKQGDSLEKIAKSFKVNVEKLRKANSLNQDLIVVGQELKIPE